MALSRREFDQVMAAHEPLLRSRVLAQVGASQGLDADEIVQDVRIRLWQALSGPREIANLAAYLRTTVVSVVIDALRRRTARREDPLESMTEPVDARTGEDPAQRADRAQRVADARAAIAALPERRRVPAQLLLQGFTTREIALMQGSTEATVRNLAYRGVEEVRAALRERGIEDWHD